MNNDEFDENFYEREYRRRLNRTARVLEIVEVIVTLALAFVVGMCAMDMLYDSDIWYDAISLAGRIGLVPGYETTEPFDRGQSWTEKEEDTEERTVDDGIEKDVPGSQKEETEEKAKPQQNTVVKEFVPVENPPVLALASAGDNVYNVSEIHDMMESSVVAIISYAEEDKNMGYGLGSGVIFTSDGYILTNSHVVEGGYSIDVVFSDVEVVPAKLIANDTTADLAILKVEKEDLPAAEFGNSNELKVGEQVVAIGCPASLELMGTTTVGNVSAVNRRVTVDTSGNRRTFIQTDASVNPGNSGGPLINMYGQVVGIITAKLSAYSYEGIGFAIPSQILVDAVADLFQYGYVRGFPSIGIMAKGVYENEMGVHPQGVYVDSVNEKGGAAGKLLPGDIIIEVEGEQVYSVADINEIKSNYKVGDTLHMKVWRMNETVEVVITLKDQHDLD